jgi:mannosyltransferase OCH1-like enzyme
MLKIPKIFHRIWIGDNPMPQQFIDWGKSWLEHHPDWEMREWNDVEEVVVNKDCLPLSRNLSQTSDILRYELLYRYGGIYLDTDFVCQKNIEALLEDADFVGAGELPNMVSAGFIAVIPQHPLIWDVMQSLPERIRSTTMNQARATGPGMLTAIWEKYKFFPEIKSYGPALFYPYSWKQRYTHRHLAFPEAYAVHHWAGSWLKEKHD